jgi:UDP-N-acetylmuramoyl-tripeptide--D-alanyl-D-alanine ligase
MKNIQELHQLFLASPKISTDSRNDVAGSLFFALSGDHFNGNVFAKEALDKGAVLAVVDDPAVCANHENYFLVDNVLETLQNLALFHRETLKTCVIGITGSNGKTTTKELISRVLESEKNVVATQGNLNNHIGVPLTLLRMTTKTQIAVVEMGANHPGEIALLCELARPNLGLITNIGKAHLEGMGSYEGVIKAKNELFSYIRINNGTAIVNADDPLLMELSEGMHRLTYGTGLGDVNGIILEDKPWIKLAEVSNNEAPIQISTQLYGRYNFPNIMAAIALGRYFKIRDKHIIKAIEGYVPANSRSQQLVTGSNHLFLDAYNANPVSMSEALKSFQHYGAENAWLILGDMFELGSSSEKEHQQMMDLVSQLEFKNVILVGKHFYGFKSNRYLFFETTSDTLAYLKENPIMQANILIKGSRGMKLEQLIPLL